MHGVLSKESKIQSICYKDSSIFGISCASFKIVDPEHMTSTALEEAFLHETKVHTFVDGNTNVIRNVELHKLGY